MKNYAIWVLILGLLGLSTNGHAVKVSDCPASIDLQIGQFDVIPLDGIQRERPQHFEAFSQQIKQLHEALSKIESKRLMSRLLEKKNSTCVYLPEGEGRALGDNEMRLYTSKGRDILRVALNLGIPYVFGSTDGRASNINDYAWIYFSVQSYGPMGVQIKQQRGYKVFALNLHGAPEVHMAWAKSVSTK